MTTPLELGAVFELPWAKGPVRVIAFDESVVMYDVWWPDKNAWSLAKPPSKVAYYRLPRSLFLQRASFERLDPYAAEEHALHRPDLPFSFAQCAGLSWYGQVPSAHDIELALRARPNAHRGTSILAANAIYIEPFGPRDGAVPAVRVTCSAPAGFTEAELLVAAWEIQAPHLRAEVRTEGVGLHRSGLHRRIPSYYIWGSQSRLQTTRSNEA
jgi:hypothetical protein